MTPNLDAAAIGELRATSAWFDANAELDPQYAFDWSGSKRLLGWIERTATVRRALPQLLDLAEKALAPLPDQGGEALKDRQHWERDFWGAARSATDRIASLEAELLSERRKGEETLAERDATRFKEIQENAGWHSRAYVAEKELAESRAALTKAEEEAKSWRRVAERLEEEAKALREALEDTLSWAEAKCPCHDETVDPCPLCGASVAKGVCMAAENTIPPRVLSKLYHARVLSPTPSNIETENKGR